MRRGKRGRCDRPEGLTRFTRHEGAIPLAGAAWVPPGLERLGAGELLHEIRSRPAPVLLEEKVAGEPRAKQEGADEIAFLDIAAAHENRGTLVNLISRVAEALSIPFTVGGGVRSVEDADALLRAGADRVVVNTAAVADPELVRRLSVKFGAQCVVVAVDGQRVRGSGGDTRMVVTTHGGRHRRARSRARCGSRLA